MIFPGSSSVTLAIFDNFPECSEIDDHGDGKGSNTAHYSYVSPIVAINQDIRRKNVAAAAAATTGPHLSLVADTDVASSDPWGVTSDQQEEYTGDTSRHQPSSDPKNKKQQRRYSLACVCMRCGPSSPLHTSRSARALSFDANTCPKCGKKITSSPGSMGVAAATVAATSTTAAAKSPSEYMLLAGEPQQAQALLHSTPNLRFLSPESADMQGAGLKQNGNVLLQLVGWNSPSGGAVAGVGSSSTSAMDASTGHTYTSSSVHAVVGGAAGSIGNTSGSNVDEYQASLIRDRANQLAASELASLLWVLAHEMSLEDFSEHESEVFSAVFGLVHSGEKEHRLAGLAAVDALLATPSADEEKKAIKFANTLATGLRLHGDYEFLSGVSRALGTMAKRTSNADFVESQITQALEWLRAERSDRR